MAAGRDYVGVVHWCGFTAGVLVAGAGLGDPHLPWLFGAGIILACEMLVALVIRWGFRRHVPGGATPISDAPSALALAVDNARRIDLLDLRSHDLLCIMSEASLAATAPGVPSVPRNAVILKFPVERTGSGGRNAGLWSVALPEGFLCCP
jgi:hypothetical protein